MAWCGGTIAEQTTTIATGTTHGAAFETATLVGDVDAGNQQLVNMLSNRGLEAGALYTLAGPGIADGTFFLFDDTILAGLPDSINLSQAATATARSASFVATKSVPIATIAGTLTQGSNIVGLGGALVPAGVYGIYGTGIGETDSVEGPGIVTVGSAWMICDGSSGTAAMYTHVAVPITSAGEDMFGQPITLTTYSVAARPVRATTTGTFGVQLTGFPTGDPAVITDISSASLLALVPGLVYNISGNGIAVGSTFVAPASGATELTLDLPATASDIGAILTITGPRTPNAPFDPVLHARFDEDILGVEIAQDEGGFATLTASVRNPNVGLLALGRNLWAWLSWDQAWPDGTPDLVPLFNGRLVGVPKLSAGEIVQLEFIARPDDLNVQKAELSASLQVLPYYDPVWLASNVTPDTVLETYSALYHIDRTSLAMTVSDIIEGEAGIIDIGEDQAIYDRFSLSYGQPPLVAAEVSGTVTWTQQAEGSIDVSERIIRAFGAAGSGYKHAFAQSAWHVGGGGMISCLCGDGLKSDWPRPGTSIGGGWNLSTLNDPGGTPLCYILDATVGNQGGWIMQSYYNVHYSGQLPPDSQAGNSEEKSNVNVFLQPFGAFTAQFPLNVYKIRMVLQYKANRTRTETVTAVVAAGVQRELSDSTESDREAISLSSTYVGEAVDLDGSVPIGNTAYRSYFQTGRGAQSFEYLLLAARAKMRARARAVDITFAVDWRTALGITLQHSVQYFDRRVPGGVAVGKVKSYRLSAGTAGMLGEFTLGCTIGTDEAISPQPGVPSYVNAGYVFSGYQTMPGQQVALTGSEIAYETFDSFAVVDDGLDLTNLTADKAINLCVVHNGLSTQLPEMAKFQNTVAPTGGDPLNTMRTLTTTVTLDLKPVAGSEFHTRFYPAVTPLMLPKTIDLSAVAPG
jgi:hypothetical protein